MDRTLSRTLLAILTAAVFAFSALPLMSIHEEDGGPAEGVASAQPVDIRPNLLEVELVTLSESSISVSWVTNVEADSRLEYGATEEYGSTVEDDTHTRYHMLEAGNLRPDTVYHYRIGSGLTDSPDAKVRTLPMPGGGGYQFSFAVAGDPHYSIVPADPNGRQTSESHDICVATVEELDSRPELEFALLLGDFADTGTEEEFDGLAEVLDDLGLTYHCLPGNHDKGQSDGTAGMEKLGGDGWEIGGYMYGVREYFGRTFVGLDSAQDPYQTPGWVPEEQLEMMVEAMSPSGGSAESSFAFLHHPGEMDDDDIEQFDALDNREDLQNALANATLAGGTPLGVFAGHTHRNSVRFAEATGGMPYFTVAAIVEYPIGYSVVNVYSEGYTVHFRKIPGALEQSEASRQRQRVAYGSANRDARMLGPISERSLSVTVTDDGEFDIVYGAEDSPAGPVGPTPGGTEGGPRVVMVQADPSRFDIDDPVPVTITAQVSDPDGKEDIVAVVADVGELDPGRDDPTLAMNDEGENGDDAAGDGVWSVLVAGPRPREAGPVTVTVTAVDTTGLQGEGNATVTVTEEVYGDGDGDEGSDDGSTPGFGGPAALLALVIVVLLCGWLMGRDGGRRREGNRKGGCVRHNLCYRGGR